MKAPTWRAEELRGKDLSGQDLRAVKGLLPKHLAGTNLTDAKLPDDLAKFLELDQVKAISEEARKVFIGLLAACVYCWLVIGTTEDVQLIVNTATSPLPIINTPIPIAGFYVVGAALLTAVYCYFQFYLQRLWRTLSTLPVVFPDGVALDDKSDPWLLTNLVRLRFDQLKSSATLPARLESLVAVLLAWWLVPITLLMLWARYLPAHGFFGTGWLVWLVTVATLVGAHSYVLARETLSVMEGPKSAEKTHSSRSIFTDALRAHFKNRNEPVVVGQGLLILLVAACSIIAFHDILGIQETGVQSSCGMSIYALTRICMRWRWHKDRKHGLARNGTR